jgi:protoporphyrinogen/coproporphyrinogen III oxidase
MTRVTHRGPLQGSHVAVVGGGISGLAAAERLGRAGVRVTVLESGSRVGGKLATGELAGVVLDVGAEAVLARRPEAVALAERCGLADRVVNPAAAGAYVWTRGHLRPLPRGTLLGIPGDLRDLARSRVLALHELLRLPLDHVLPGTPLEGDVALGTYVAHRLGRGVTERLVEPLLGGIYAGHADQISLEAALPELHARLVSGAGGSLLDAVAALVPPASDAPVFASLKGGLGTLPAAVALASGAEVRTGSTVRGLARRARGWRLTIGATEDETTVDVDGVVVAVPATPAARLLAVVAPGAGAALPGVPYASVALVTYAFRRGDLPALQPGTGFLVPPVEHRVVKASTFCSTKWGWLARAAPDLVFVRVSVGRYGEEADLQRDDADLAAAGLADLGAALGWGGGRGVPLPVDVRVDRWGGALPQYLVGHRSRVERVRAAVAEQPALAVCGAAYDGVGVPACIASGIAAADTVLAGLATLAPFGPRGLRE